MYAIISIATKFQFLHARNEITYNSLQYTMTNQPTRYPRATNSSQGRDLIKVTLCVTTMLFLWEKWLSCLCSVWRCTCSPGRGALSSGNIIWVSATWVDFCSAYLHWHVLIVSYYLQSSNCGICFQIPVSTHSLCVVKYWIPWWLHTQTSLRFSHSMFHLFWSPP